MTTLPTSTAAEALHSSKTLVVKIGSSLLVDDANQHFNREWFDTFIADIAKLKQAGKRIAVVSSGAVALGCLSMQQTRRQLQLARSQAMASIGQISLAKEFEHAFKQHGVVAAQILLTLDDTEVRKRYLNARNALDELLAMGVVPVINENDTVATAEIRYGDNDRLAARVAQTISADCLVLLSDVEGLYEADPRNDHNATLITRVDTISPEIERMAGASNTAFGTGGMVTKIDAAKLAVQSGCQMILASGQGLHPLQRIAEHSPCTLFVSASSPITARKKWIAASLKVQGVLTIDEGAAEALKAGGSLLPVGLVDVSGKFERGDAVQVRTVDRRNVGRGLVAYGADELNKIKGQQSGKIASILNYRGPSQVIHRDDLSFHD